MAPSHPIPVLSLAEAHARLTAPGARFETETVAIRGVPTRVWRHVPGTARALFDLLQGHGDKTCLVYENERIGYDAFARACLTFAAALQHAGLAKGDRVALMMRNLPEWPVVLLGSLLAGAIVVPLNAWWTVPELAFALADSGARFAVCDGERLSRLQEARVQCPALERLWVTRAEGTQEAARLEDIIGAPPAWTSLQERAPPDLLLAPEDDATIFYTSGTSGTPKGALGTHRNLTTNIFAAPFSNARNALRFGAPPCPPGPRANLLAVPLFHVIGCLSILIPSLAAGGKIVLMRKFEAEAALALIARERITIAGGVPTIALALLEQADSHDLSSLELLSYGGAPSPADLADRIAATLPGALPGNGWGMTETSATCTVHSGPDYLLRPDSCGPALPVSAIKVMVSDRKAAPGDVGELWAFGPNVVKGYWNRPADTAETFREGWVKTGDLARIDAEGFCTIVDRARDMVIRGGENIYCIEVEQVLCAHPLVADAALIGMAHPQLGEVPAAVIQTLGPLDTAELQAFAAARLAPFKLPVKIVMSPMPLPRNEGGKILKQTLKAALA